MTPRLRPQSRSRSRPGFAARRRAARIAAVQALYQIALSGTGPERAIGDVLRIDPRDDAGEGGDDDAPAGIPGDGIFDNESLGAEIPDAGTLNDGIREPAPEQPEDDGGRPEAGRGTAPQATDAGAVETGATDAEATEARLDSALLHDVVFGVTAGTAALDRTVGAAIARGRRLEEAELLLRLILRSGCWELMQCPETDSPVIIKEYVAVTSAFFSGPEPGFVNGVLDRLARDLRGPGAEEPDVQGPGAEKSDAKEPGVKEPGSEGSPVEDGEGNPGESGQGKDGAQGQDGDGQPAR